MDQCFEYCDSYSHLTQKAIFHPECALTDFHIGLIQGKIVTLQQVYIQASRTYMSHLCKYFTEVNRNLKDRNLKKK